MAKNIITKTIQITAYKKEDFRKWLHKNHLKESKVAVVVHKKHTGKGSPSHRELMEEAICYGWIDTIIKSVDRDSFIRFFSKRTKNSRWSDNTLSYAKRLITEGKMVEQGLHYYKEGLAKPTHDHGIPKNPDMPPELKKALLKEKLLKKFEYQSLSMKRTHYRWIIRGKQQVTRDKRIKKIVEELGKK